MRIVTQKRFFDYENHREIDLCLLEIFGSYFTLESITEDGEVSTELSVPMDLTWASETFRDKKRNYAKIYYLEEI